MSYNDRVETWAEKNSKKLKILYCIWAFGLVIGVIGFATGTFDNITFDADKVPVGLMDNKVTSTGEEVCIDLFDDEGKHIGEQCMTPIHIEKELERFELIGIPQLPVQGYESDWDCEDTEQFGTVEECNEYWDNISEYAEENGRLAMLQKLNDDGHLSDVIKSYIYEVEGIKLP